MFPLVIFEILASFGQHEVLIPLVAVGLVFKKDVFLPAVILMLFSGIFSSLLKFGFNIPYPDELVQKLGKDGLSFPSGHMQAATSFYGWFLAQRFDVSFKRLVILRVILAGIIIGIAVGIIGLGYHNIYHILGGIFFASILIYLYRFSIGKAGSDFTNFSLLIDGLLFMILMQVFYHLPLDLIKSISAILGIVIYSYFFMGKDLGKKALILFASAWFGLFLTVQGLDLYQFPSLMLYLKI